MHTGILLEDCSARDTNLLQCASVLHGAEPGANNPISRGQVSFQRVPALFTVFGISIQAVTFLKLSHLISLLPLSGTPQTYL